MPSPCTVFSYEYIAVLYIYSNIKVYIYIITVGGPVLQTLYITVPPRQFYGTRFMNYGPLPYGGGGRRGVILGIFSLNMCIFFIKLIQT
jgi:hypothetical protein